ncbi:MAG: exosortase N [Cytophagales bacterium]|nr:exosortase N [Cytophagales bacterium]
MNPNVRASLSLPPVHRRADLALTAALLGACLLAAVLRFAPDYWLMDGLFILGCVLAPYLFIMREPGTYSYRYAVPAAGLALLAAWVPLNTFGYGAFAFALLFLLEIRVGKLNPLPVLLLGLLSPVFRYVTEVFGFPIRLHLSAAAGWLIGQMGTPVEVQGNVLVRDGFAFAVDPACVGLQLVTVSFLVALFLLAHLERSTGRQLSASLTGVALLATGGLVVLANLIRIVLLVVFRLLPDSPLHDLAGLACLIAYVALPVCFLFGFLYRRLGRAAGQSPAQPGNPSWRRAAVPAVLLAALVLLPSPAQVGQTGSLPLPFESLPGYGRTTLAGGITQFTQANALMYVKPIAAFYSTEHSPLICWRGSGYAFGRINERSVGGYQVYTGELTKGADVLYTAWWFDNGTHRTTAQWEWRWRMLRGAPPYSLVNLSAATPAGLEKALQGVLDIRRETLTGTRK